MSLSLSLSLSLSVSPRKENNRRRGFVFHKLRKLICKVRNVERKDGEDRREKTPDRLGRP
jgi:hypothetical protein